MYTALKIKSGVVKNGGAVLMSKWSIGQREDDSVCYYGLCGRFGICHAAQRR